MKVDVATDVFLSLTIPYNVCRGDKAMRRILMFVLLFAFSQPVLAQKANDQNKTQQPETPPSVNVTPASLDFGEQVVKRTSKPKRLTVTNNGGKALYITRVVLGGDNQQELDGNSTRLN